MQDRWYYRFEDKEIGPVSFADLLALAQQNPDFVTATVREDSSRMWLPAANLQALWPGKSTSGKREPVPIPGPKPISKPGPEPSDKTPLADFFFQACDAARRLGGATFAWLHQVLLYLFLRAEGIGLRRRVRQSKSRFGETLCLVNHGAPELRQQIKALEDQADSHPGGNRLDPRHWRERQKLLLSLAETSLSEETVPEEARSDHAAVMEAVAALETNGKKIAEVNIGSGPLIVTGIGVGIVVLCASVGMIVSMLGGAGVVTSVHDEVFTVWVFFTKEECHEAELVHCSDEFDLAVVKVPADNLPTFQLSTSDVAARAESVYALGYPGFVVPVNSGRQKNIVECFDDTAFDFTMTRGTVSRATEEDDIFWIQHDSAIHKGNSGGPLVNEAGVVLGINTLGIEPAKSIAFAMTTGQLRKQINDKCCRTRTLEVSRLACSYASPANDAQRR